MRLALGAIAAALLIAPGAAAKNFQPGDLRVCNSERCVPIMNRAALNALADSLFKGPPPTPTADLAIGAPTYELRFPNGYVTGLVGGERRDRFLSHGVYLGHFVRGKWHPIAPRAAAELRRLTRNLAPIPLTRAAIAKSR
jgi:hypothetical protein